MSALILNRAVVDNDIVFVDDEAAVPASGKVVVSLARWQQQNGELHSAAAEIGVRLPNTVDIATIWNELKDRRMIVIDFPGFGDGRAYSQARLLRDRYDFKGDIVATGGAVVRDQISNMSRSGINGFLLRGDQDPKVCLTGFNDFTSAYQAASDGNMPIVREQRRNIA